MKKLLITLVVIFSSFVFIFANGNKESNSKRIVKIKFPTAGASGALYSIGALITNLWNEKLENVNASSHASAGGIDNLNQVADGESQVSIAISSNCWQSYHGTDVFYGSANPDLRVIAGLYYNPNQVVVTKKSNINSLTDIKGKHFAVAALGSSVEGECKNHFSAAGLEYPDDIRVEYISFSDSADLLQNGQLDGAWIMSGAPAGAVTQALSSGCKLISVENEVIEKLKESYPWYSEVIIPAGTYPDQSEDIHTTAIKMVMFCSAGLDDEIVYSLTKTFWENIEELGKTQPNLKGLTPRDAVVDIADLPIHNGAMRYYSDIHVL